MRLLSFLNHLVLFLIPVWMSANNKWGKDMVRVTGPLFHLEAGWEQALEPRLVRLAGIGNFN